MLYTILGARRLTDEVLHTTFCLVENALNSHHLTPVSANPCNLNALTPNHFLLGEYSTGVPSLVGNNEFNHRKRYARAQSYANAIWSRWIREYVPTLNRRSKWQTPAEQYLKTGELVWRVEETNPRCYYTTARILELRYGSDSFARSVDCFTCPPACKTYDSFPIIFFRDGGCYIVNKTIYANQNRVFLNNK